MAHYNVTLTTRPCPVYDIRVIARGEITGLPTRFEAEKFVHLHIGEVPAFPADCDFPGQPASPAKFYAGIEDVACGTWQEAVQLALLDELQCNDDIGADDTFSCTHPDTGELATYAVRAEFDIVRTA